MRLSALMLLAMPVVLPAAQETGFLNRNASVDGTTYKFQVYVPADYSSDRQWPVILFLHGAGERGEDGLVETEVGLGSAIRKHVDRYPAIVVMPQCRKDHWWTEPSMEAQALAALDQSIREFHGDADRIYLTGLSMGGYGTWAIGARHPEKFAALAPVCGGIRLPARLRQNQPETEGDPYADAANKVAKKPIWVHHGGADPTVPVSESRKMVELLKAASANVRYSEYEGVGHNSWDKAYNDPEFAAWLLAQKLSH